MTLFLFPLSKDFNNSGLVREEELERLDCPPTSRVLFVEYEVDGEDDADSNPLFSVDAVTKKRFVVDIAAIQPKYQRCVKFKQAKLATLSGTNV